MSVASAVLLAIATAFVGYLVGGVLIPYLNTRHSERRRATSGLTMSQVLDLIVLASESGIAVVDQFHDVVLSNPRAEELGLVRNRSIDERAWAAATKVLALDRANFAVGRGSNCPSRSPMFILRD